MSQTKQARLVPQTGEPGEEVVHLSSFGIVKQGGKVLLMKMIRPERHAGKWALPALVINYGENPLQAISRVTQSSLGVAPKGVRILDVQSYGDKHWDICFVYKMELSGPEAHSQDVESVEYFDLAALPAGLLEGHREVLQSLIDSRLA
ncbi:MAG: NUDIX domain-containing protein [Thaumarchaeota archaeon]|nr:NUDIX domain-containing protein [Nitrososphaerota archaeon]